jgi:SAM-dependent methyltransferase
MIATRLLVGMLGSDILQAMRYEEDYASNNPQWHLEDAEDKVGDVLTAIARAQLTIHSICDIGCGVGEVLAQLHRRLQTERTVGYDVSHYAIELAKQREGPGLTFLAADASSDSETFDVMLLLDVLEHVPDPVGFLKSVRHKAPTAIINLPLELSALKVLSGDSLARGRRALGHLHYFNERLAFEMLREAGFEVRDSWFSPPGTGRAVPDVKRRALRFGQRIATRANPSVAARTIGGSSLMMVAAVSPTEAPVDRLALEFRFATGPAQAG